MRPKTCCYNEAWKHTALTGGLVGFVLSRALNVSEDTGTSLKSAGTADMLSKGLVTSLKISWDQRFSSAYRLQFWDWDCVNGLFTWRSAECLQAQLKHVRSSVHWFSFNRHRHLGKHIPTNTHISDKRIHSHTEKHENLVKESSVFFPFIRACCIWTSLYGPAPPPISFSFYARHICTHSYQREMRVYSRPHVS